MIVAATLENADIALSYLQSLIVPIYATVKAFNLVTEVLNLSQERADQIILVFESLIRGHNLVRELRHLG